MALRGRGLARFVHPGLLDVITLGPHKKSALGRFFVEGHGPEDPSDTGWNARRLNPAHLPGNQNANEEHNGQSNTEGQCRGHLVFGWCQAFFRGRAAAHHVQKRPDQACQNGQESDDNQYFHVGIIQ